MTRDLATQPHLWVWDGDQLRDPTRAPGAPAPRRGPHPWSDRGMDAEKHGRACPALQAPPTEPTERDGRDKHVLVTVVLGAVCSCPCPGLEEPEARARWRADAAGPPSLPPSLSTPPHTHLLPVPGPVLLGWVTMCSWWGQRTGPGVTAVRLGAVNGPEKGLRKGPVLPVNTGPRTRGPWSSPRPAHAPQWPPPRRRRPAPC